MTSHKQGTEPRAPTDIGAEFDPFHATVDVR